MNNFQYYLTEES